MEAWRAARRRQDVMERRMFIGWLIACVIGGIVWGIIENW